MPDPACWGPDNPYPLSQMRTELVRNGKYDEYGRRRSVDVTGAVFPMQKIETVDRSPGSEALTAGLNFISRAILLVLSPLFLARMIYLIFLSVSFTTLFFFPMPN